MREEKPYLADILVQGLSNMLIRSKKVNSGDQLAIAQEYREWINCISASDFTNQEILVIDKFTFK